MRCGDTTVITDAVPSSEKVATFKIDSNLTKGVPEWANYVKVS